MEMNCRAVAAAVNGSILQAGSERNIRRFVIDSRLAADGDFFVPLKGEHTDGHHYVQDAAQNGAIGCFVSRNYTLSSLPHGMFVIAVDNTLTALQQAAAAYRRHFALPVIGVTGSVGKTTTKDMIAAVLSARLRTLKTEGNLNNEIGLPLMLTRLEAETEAAVLEMGMSGFGEIARLAALAKPTVGVITNIGESHLEILGTREGIARAKSELLLALPPEGAAVVNGDEPLLLPHTKNLPCPVITFGFAETATVRCRGLEGTDGRKKVLIEQAGYPLLRLELPLPGRHNVYNLLAAVAVGRLLHLTDDEIRDGLAKLQPTAMRQEIVTLPGGVRVINDAYNASPTSMAAALDLLQELSGGAGRIAVLGDMLELGDMEEEGHRQVGRLAAQSNLKALLVLGERAAWIARGAKEAGMAEENIYHPASHAETALLLQKLAQQGDYVLLKGSRGMRMEKVLQLFQGEEK
ncbi:MAG: UDP-N-acetylmuramoyl-tripeptide--D-alanyl-D-alanine ligase [Firmicutes bacterium]|nr:UDP-N-acetylmuramoyl-tripeptide--D-alanyl-D-alanine ligase [Bacillota bacterium]